MLYTIIRESIEENILIIPTKIWNQFGNRSIVILPLFRTIELPSLNELIYTKLHQACLS